MLEYEKKLMLTEREYRQLLHAFHEDSATTLQTNFYFDTDDFSMNQKGITCRIRSKNGKFKATVKNHIKNHSELSIEKTMDLGSQLDLQVFELMGLHLQGCLVTERCVVYKDPFCEFVLDRNTYLGQTDYEMEIEYAVEQEQLATCLLNKSAHILFADGIIGSKEEFLSRVSSSASKSQRFFERRAMK